MLQDDTYAGPQTGETRDSEASYVYRDRRFDKALHELLRQGGTAAFITEKAETMITALTRGSHRLSELGKQTRNGEHRIDQCFKFDLGSGYRMVCLRLNEYLVFLYIGTHDDCCRWIERNKGMKYEIRDESRRIPVAKKDFTAASGISSEIEGEQLFVEEYERSIMNRLDDDMLRRIFGLAGSDH